MQSMNLLLQVKVFREQLEDAVAWCKERGLEFDAVNENLPELIELYGNDCRKINADIYIDDKAVNSMRRRQIAGLTSLNPYDNPTDRETFAQIQKQKEAERKESNQNEEAEKNSESDIQTEETRETETKL